MTDADHQRLEASILGICHSKAKAHFGDFKIFGSKEIDYAANCTRQ